MQTLHSALKEKCTLVGKFFLRLYLARQALSKEKEGKREKKKYERRRGEIERGIKSDLAKVTHR
jgi:hypothetical protein